MASQLSRPHPDVMPSAQTRFLMQLNRVQMYRVFLFFSIKASPEDGLYVECRILQY